jgi:hypothetical protein
MDHMRECLSDWEFHHLPPSDPEDDHSHDSDDDSDGDDHPPGATPELEAGYDVDPDDTLGPDEPFSPVDPSARPASSSSSSSHPDSIPRRRVRQPVARSRSSSPEDSPPRRRLRPSLPSPPTLRRAPMVVRVLPGSGGARREVFPASSSGTSSSSEPMDIRVEVEGAPMVSGVDAPVVCSARTPSPVPPEPLHSADVDRPSLNAITAGVWVGRGVPLPPIPNGTPSWPELEGELSYVRATYIWELAVIYRNLVVRTLVDVALTADDHRFINE